MVGDDFNIENSIGCEDVYEFEEKIDIEEFSKKYNLDKKQVLKAYKKVF